MSQDANPVPLALPEARRAGVEEMRTRDGQPRPGQADLQASISQLGAAGLQVRRAQVRGLLEDDGVTYGTPAGPWDVDPVPLVLDAAQWQQLRSGLVQRAQLLDLVFADLYGPRSLLRSGLLPPEVVFGHPGFLRDADRIRTPATHQLLLTATDLARDVEGRWRVLADRTQAPSGAGYAMENRRVVSRVMAGLYRDLRPARLRTFFHALRSGLEEAAGTSAEAPRVVLLTPGAAAETAFDQAFLATMLGYPLVEGADLTVRDGRVWLRSLGRPVPVDVVLRRVDAWYADPLELRPDSRLGVPGLVEATRWGHVSVVNPLGAGVLENPGLVPFLPRLARELLGGPLLLPDVETFWCGDDVSRRYVLDHLDQLVIRPIARGVGRSGVFGWEVPAEERDELRRRIEAEGWSWCAQQPLPLSRVPVVTDTGLASRGLILRTFAVGWSGGYEVMAGGLARAAGDGSGLLVTSQAGAVAKDVWVQAADPGEASPEPTGPGHQVSTSAAPPAPTPVAVPAVAVRAAEDLFWLGRYAERAEDTARLLRVAADLAEDYARRPGSSGAAALRVLLGALAEVTGTLPAGLAAGYREAAPADVPRLDAPRLDAPRLDAPRLAADLLALTVDVGLPGGLGYAVLRAVEAAHAVREQLSVDTWVVLGSLDRVLAELADAAADVEPGQAPALQPTLARVLEGMLALAGLGAESMVRDAGWAVMDAGRRVERGLQVVALLRHTVCRQRPPIVDGLVVESVLLAAESVITHRRRSAAGTLPSGSPSSLVCGVLQLLLGDRANPRGLAYQLERLVEDLDHVEPARISGPGPDRTGPRGAVPDVGLRAQVQELVARVRQADLSGLAVAEASGLRPALARLLDELSGDLQRLSAALETAHFGHRAPPRPLPEGSGWGAG